CPLPPRSIRPSKRASPLPTTLTTFMVRHRISVTSPTTTPNKSAASFSAEPRDELYRQRQDVLRSTGARPVLTHLSARARILRRQERLRRRRLRGLHCVARRQTFSLLSDARLSLRGERDHDYRGAGARRQAAPNATGVSRRPGLSMWILRRGYDHDLDNLR